MKSSTSAEKYDIILPHVKPHIKLPNLNIFPRQLSSILLSQVFLTLIKWGKTNEDSPLQSIIHQKEETLNMNHLSEDLFDRLDLP